MIRSRKGFGKIIHQRPGPGIRTVSYTHLVKEIIQAHGENIDVISTAGVGSEFIFTLPRAVNL